MNYKIAIVENDANDLALLETNLDFWNKTKNYDFDIKTFSCAEDFLEKYDSSFNVVFMDIELSGMNGMRAAQKLREFDETVILIFVTNSKQYAVNGYSVNALNYILKPINFYSFSLTMDRCIRSLRTDRPKIAAVKVVGGFKNIVYNDIYCIEIMEHDIVFHTSNGNVESYGSLNEWEKKLSDGNFSRSSSSMLVNLENVKGVLSDIVTVGNYTVRLSRSKKKTFMQDLMTYLGGK